MTVTLIVLVMGGLIWWLLSHQTKNASDAPRYSFEAMQMAETIKTKADMERLQREITKLESKTYRSDAAEEKAASKLELLQEVETIATDKPLGWQFVPSWNINIPSKALVYAYKIFAADAAERSLSFLSDRENGSWTPLSYYDEPEDTPPWLEPLKKLRNIVESYESISQKVAAIDALYESSAALEEIFPVPENLSAGQEWAALELKKIGVPKARELVLEGILSVDDVLKVDPADFRKRPGVGPKTHAAFVACQDAIRGASR